MSPIPLATATRHVLLLPTTYLFASYHFGSATLAYSALFFQPLLYSELLPSWAPWQVASLVTAPQLLTAVYAALVASFTDRPTDVERRFRRRLGFGLLSPIVGATCQVFGAAALLCEGLSTAPLSRASHFTVSALALVVMAVGATAGSGAAGPFWALHHEVQPTELRGASIAIVNSIGNLGGFVGPYLLAAGRASLGPACPPVASSTAEAAAWVVQGRPAQQERHHDSTSCVSSWSGGLMVVNCLALSVFFVVTIIVTRYKRRLLN